MTFDLYARTDSARRRLTELVRTKPLRIAAGIGVPLLAASLITAGLPGLGDYRIKRGDTLTEIADRYGTTVRNLVRINDLPGNGNLIYAGELLKVPVRRTTPRVPANVRIIVYVVKPGDTVSEIAHRFHIRSQAVLRANGLRASSRIYAGRPLRVPVPKPAVKPGKKCTPHNCFGGRTYPANVVAAADRNRALLSHRRLPTRGHMRTIIARTARAHGVDPNLALAVAWQESGWKQRVVSPANAIGAMQVLPSTARFSADIVGRRLDLLNARDNATAGVVLLDWLTRAASVPNAVAGYYQGLGSVRRHGMYDDTKRYVANVLRIKHRLDQGWDPLR
ncbi:MAG TPA: LysM peptidoglycan-binding domain-containing protein [Kribbellaceae bacterium]|nr:LysM peptidoglycan-binding domain-containing protein [Kribbellaceae bacterium]